MKARFFNDVGRKGGGGPAPPGRPGFMRQRLSGAFTVLELITAMAILVLLVGLLSAAFNQASKAWTFAENRVETFTDARAALDFMAKELSQAITTAQIPFLAQEETSYTLGAITPPPLPVLHFGNVAFVASVGNGATDGMDLMEVVYRLSRVSATGGAEGPHGGTPPIPSVFVDPLPGPYKLVRRVSPYAPPATAHYWNYGSQSAAGAPPPLDFYVPAFAATWPETSWLEGTQVLAENVVSLQFGYYDDQPRPPAYVPPTYWNSTSSPAWNNELNTAVPPGATTDPNMQNRAPSRVIITLVVLDSRAAVRYKATSDQEAKRRIYQESQRTFTTSVYIPNRQP